MPIWTLANKINKVLCLHYLDGWWVANKSHIIKEEVLDKVGVVAVDLDGEEDLLLLEALAEEVTEPIGSIHRWILLYLLGHLASHLDLALFDLSQLLLKQLLLVSVLQLLHL